MEIKTHATPWMKPLDPVGWFERRRWLTVADWRYRLPQGQIGLIPRKFLTDLASVPWGLRTLASPTGPLSVPALWHDFGYAHDYLLIDTGDGVEKWYEGNGRRFWDDLMWQIANDRRPQDKLINDIVWQSVRQFGKGAWEAHRRGKPPEFYQHADGVR